MDKEKVIKGLELCRKFTNSCEGCPYESVPAVENCMFVMHDDALALLKEQGKPDCEHADHDGIGCLGYAGCTQDDEPIEACKRCEKYTGNVYEAVK